MRQIPFMIVALVAVAGFGSASHAIEVKDGRGKVIRLPAPPQRIVSTSLASDEILLALLKQGRDRLLAVSKLATDPRYSTDATEFQHGKLATVGTELESLLALKPDLVVLASYNRPDFIRKLDAAGVPTFVLNQFDSLEDVRSNMLTLGHLIGRQAAAKQLVSKTFDPLKRFKVPSTKKTVISYDDNLILPAKNTIFDSLCKSVHLENVATKKGLAGWAKVGQETLLTFNPDFIVVPLAPTESHKQAAKKVQDHPTFGRLPASKQGRFIFVPAAQLTSVSQHVRKAAEALYQGAYGS